MSLSLHLNHFAFNINYPRLIKKKKKSSNVRIVIVKIIHKLFHDRQIQQETVVFKTSITEKKKKNLFHKYGNFEGCISAANSV